MPFQTTHFRTRIRRRPRRGLRPSAEALENRLALDATTATYTWTALGDGTSFNDPNNWSHVGPLGGGVGVPGVPVIGSNLVFPAMGLLPAGSPSTIDFNSGIAPFPVGVIQIGDSYTFSGNGVSVAGGILVANPYFGKPTDATILLARVNLSRHSTIYTQAKSILNLGDAADTTGVRLNVEGGVSKSGDGQLVIDTSAITEPLDGHSLQTFEVVGGVVALGTSMDFSNTRFQVDVGTALNLADNAAVKVGSLSGSGTLNLQGTAAASDQTGLTAFTPAGESDTFDGQVIGVGRLAMLGNGTLTLGGVDFSSAGSIAVGMGALVVDGPISAATLHVSGGSFGGRGSWHFSGPVDFQAGSTFNVSLDGPPGSGQSPLLASADTTGGINLGNSTLAGAVDYEYQAGDQFTIATAPTVQGVFGNVGGGQVLIGGSIPFLVSYSPVAVTMTAQQSLTTTRLSSSGSPSHPGEAVTFTATVGTRTRAVAGGNVRFLVNGSVAATVPVVGGTATFTTSALPLGTATVTAVFGGVGNILGSSSPAFAQVVVPYTTVTTVTSSINPSRFRQAVTLIATVTADGKPVTSGAVTFLRGSAVVGVAALGADGTARLTTSALPRRYVRIQASFAGDPEHYGSVSPAYVQVVQKAETTTSLVVGQSRFGRRVRTVLVATVDTPGLTGFRPSGVVVFYRGHRVVGRARLVLGAATLVLRRRSRPRGVFLATFAGNARFRMSRSPAVIPEDLFRFRVPME